jgi:hypothetical protein
MTIDAAGEYRYETEDKKHVYGKSDRWPGEKLLVQQINEIHATRPGFEMMLLGTSGVSGEEFPLFLTVCEFELRDEQAVEACRYALRTSDELIRRRVSPLWRWDMAWRFKNRIIFMVNWYDFAFFMKNRHIFLGKDHSRFALDFGLDVHEMRFEEYKILKDGSTVPFDIEKISEWEKEVLKNLDKIQFDRTFKESRFEFESHSPHQQK